MIKILVAAVLAAAAISSAVARAAEPSADATWEPLRFLVGTWNATTQGGSAKASGSGSYTFQLEMRKHILARHSDSASCKGPADFDCKHGDLLYIYQDAPSQAFKAIYFDSEGHVIHYDVSFPAANAAIFVSDRTVPGPQFQLLYALKGSVMSGKFQVRMPGQAEFTSYLEWSGAKK